LNALASFHPLRPQVIWGSHIPLTERNSQIVLLASAAVQSWDHLIDIIYFDSACGALRKFHDAADAGQPIIFARSFYLQLIVLRSRLFNLRNGREAWQIT